jgi:hypothetical protein
MLDGDLDNCPAVIIRHNGTLPISSIWRPKKTVCCSARRCWPKISRHWSDEILEIMFHPCTRHWELIPGIHSPPIFGRVVGL